MNVERILWKGSLGRLRKPTKVFKTRIYFELDTEVYGKPVKACQTGDVVTLLRMGEKTRTSLPCEEIVKAPI